MLSRKLRLLMTGNNEETGEEKLVGADRRSAASGIETSEQVIIGRARWEIQIRGGDHVWRIEVEVEVEIVGRCNCATTRKGPGAGGRPAPK